MSKLTDYAIVLLAHLARTGHTLTAQELAARSKVPLPTVSKLCKELSKAGIVVSHRGRRGGYGLARPAEQISVAQIVEALEGPIALTQCVQPGLQSCDIEATCLAKSSWDPVSRAIHGALQNLPLSAIAPDRVPAGPAEAAGSAPITIGVHAS
ncbi:SUF system Fe-S cluster assembly regulator [Anaeromyxobacter oryzisoli]|uniref:SUF system Fe-S cluster assembly regulator n=1 Tax=Anaeromyxobacter oryzisoli TaxID=2925408 RepID=UPI001F594622|nr:SUF system Fe-S cluster assembly regulator [Anaeromyxobacter sp. SG63]